MKNEGRRRAGRLILQGLSVLLGILVAFAIDAWWGDRSDRLAEARVLEQLADELEANLAIMDSALAFHSAVEAAATTTLNIAAQQDAGVPPDSIDHLLADLSWWGGSNWVTGTVEALISSGDIRLIEDELLRSRIAALPRAIARATAVEDQEFRSHREFWIPF